jgi:hypothetical protein
LGRGGDLDHLLIGSFGVVTVNTKTTAKPVWVGEYGMTVGGLKVDYIRAARGEARRAQARLARAAGIAMTVVPGIVFLGPRTFTVRRGGPPDVAVLPSPACCNGPHHPAGDTPSPHAATPFNWDVPVLYALARRADHYVHCTSSEPLKLRGSGSPDR